jgi:kynurenine formamidase
MSQALPSYDDLPAVPGKPPGSSWGLWGPDDVFGCLNLLTPERVVRGTGCVRKGAVFALNLDMELPGPPLFNRAAFTHTVHTTEVSHDDELSSWNTQSSSQWDGFRHIKSAQHGFYNGVDDEQHGIHHWARRGLAGRAVLADVGRWREAQGRPLQQDKSDPIEPADVLSTLEAQGTEVEPGDVLLMRTGWLSWYRAQSAQTRAAMAAGFASPGIRPGVGSARMLWDLHISAIGADNPALEVWPPGSLSTPEQMQAMRTDPSQAIEIFLHFSLLPLLGLPIGELWDLDALASDCAADGVYECLFVSAPLNLKAGVASPPNALAIK